MTKGNQLLIQLPVNGILSSVEAVRDGLIEAINVITCYDEVDQKTAFRSINALNSVLRALSTTSTESRQILFPSVFDNQRKGDLYQWLHDAIAIITSQATVDDPEGSSRSIAAISAVLRGMNPFPIESESYLRSA